MQGSYRFQIEHVLLARSSNSLQCPTPKHPCGVQTSKYPCSAHPRISLPCAASLNPTKEAVGGSREWREAGGGREWRGGRWDTDLIQPRCFRMVAQKNSVRRVETNILGEGIYKQTFLPTFYVTFKTVETFLERTATHAFRLQELRFREKGPIR